MVLLRCLVTVGILLVLPVACGPATVTAPDPAAAAAQATATRPLATATGSAAPRATTRVPLATQEPIPLPLSEPGPYRVGVREFSSQDPAREGRGVGVRVWYPANWPGGTTGKRVVPLADPDRSGAPYPLILSSAKSGSSLAPYLVTHGFVWAGVTRIDTYEQYNTEMVDQPLDILFALDQVASNPPAELQGMIDANRSGATGYSFDGYNALALSGARVDPDFYLAQCASADATAVAIMAPFPAMAPFPHGYQCAPARDWDTFAAHAGGAIPANQDGLWQPMTEPRIRAVMPLAAEGWLLFGEKGLAAVDRPTLIIVSTRDVWYPENALIFEQLGTPDKALISFVGQDHMMVFDPVMVARMAHFAVAFFGYHLQGREDLAYYYSEDFVGLHEDLAWGVYQGE